MLGKILLLANLMVSVNCGRNNIPAFDPSIKVIDCTDNMGATDICNIMFVVDPLTSMTYYNITADMRQLRGYRAAFDSNGELRTLERDLDFTTDPPPIFIQTDGHFRPLIAINGQTPGPTIIAHENQRLNITVFNELKNVEGISIHWHGMHQRGTQGADGVAYITQRPILPNQQFTYDFLAYPAGTHWYHAHSGAQRTDGMYGALIISDTIPGNLYDLDYPDQHTFILMDWQREASIDLFYTAGGGLRYWKKSSNDTYIQYTNTRASDGTTVGPIPFWSGIINDKGRHYDESGQTNIRPNRLNYFNVSQGNRYRFRLIGAQALYAFRFSIQDHKMTVVATDGNPISPIEDVDYVTINTGERYDVIVHANANTPTRGNFWIWAETLEDENIRNETFYTPINKHRAEAILHYDGNDDNIDDNIDEIRTCTPSSQCKVVNCPYKTNSDTSSIICINADEFESLPNHNIPESIYNPNTNKTLFYSFGFDGESSTSGSSIDGVNFRFPANPPQTEYPEFQSSGDMCPTRGCDHDIEPHCACTQVIDISDQINGTVVELVISNRIIDNTSPGGASHPVHLHGHYFYVVKIGYPNYTENGVFEAANDDLECILSEDGGSCENNFITVYDQNNEPKQELQWSIRPMDLDMQNKSYPRKDTVIVPFGGYTVIRFTADNPGWWFFHCHIEVHQLQGMAAVVNEMINGMPSEPDGTCTPTTCEPCTTGASQSILGSSLLIMITAMLAIISV